MRNAPVQDSTLRLACASISFSSALLKARKAIKSNWRIRLTAFRWCRSGLAATSSILLMPSPGGRYKKQNARIVDVLDVLFGRLRTLFKFYVRVSGLFAENFNSIVL
jgi:hypothetical protein